MREIFALSQLQLVPDDPALTRSAATRPEWDSPLPNWRRRGTEAWLADDLDGAADAFGKALAEEGWPLAERLDMSRLRVAALLRLKRNGAALADAKAAVALLTSAPPSAVPVETAQELWYLLGLALLSSGRAQHGAAEAADAAGRGMTTRRARGPKFDQLCELFLRAAASAPKAVVPIEAYVTAEQLGASQEPMLPVSPPAAWPPAAAHPPTYRLVLRPKFAPWPLTLTPSPAVGSAKLSLFCAHRGTLAAMAEPHVAMVCTGAGVGAEALVLVDVRADGTLEVRMGFALFTLCWQLCSHCPTLHPRAHALERSPPCIEKALAVEVGLGQTVFTPTFPGAGASLAPLGPFSTTFPTRARCSSPLTPLAPSSSHRRCWPTLRLRLARWWRRA
jgi:hypothetical protein